MRNDSPPSYGAGDFYRGEKGRVYFAQQRKTFAAEFNLRLFQPYISSKDTVLDFGCGNGQLLSLLNAQTKIGVDINEAARAEATKQGIETYPDLSALADQQFTRIITSHALEHVPSPYHALLELKRYLTDDGLLIWLSPLDDWRTKYNRQWHPNDRHMHIYTWTPKTLGNLLVTAGYTPHSVELVTHAGPPFYISKLWYMHKPLFHRVAWATSILLKRRQILAVAESSC